MKSNGSMMSIHMKRWAWNSLQKTQKNAASETTADITSDVKDETLADDDFDRTENDENEVSLGPVPEEYYHRPVTSPLEQSAWRRNSDGSDGLNPGKENQTVVRPPFREQNRPSPLATTNSYWTSSSPRNYFAVEGGINKLSSTHRSSPLSTFQNYETTTLDDTKPKRTDSSSLYPLEEVTLTSSSSSEGIQPMSSTDGRSILSASSALLESSQPEESDAAPEEKIYGNRSDPSSRLHQAYQSLSSPPRTMEVPSRHEEPFKGAFTTDSFEWAYAVWRRKGLLPDRGPPQSENYGRIYHQGTQDNNHSFLKDKGEKACANYVYQSPRKTKPWNNDQKKFSNILEKWKSQAEKQPFSSPGSCTVMQRVLDLNTENVDTKQTRKPTRRYTLHVVEKSGKYSAASLPIEQKLSTSRDLSPIGTSPKSQTWKLKTARDLCMIQEKHLKQIRSLNPDAATGSGEINALDQLQLGDQKTNSNRSKLRPRSLSLHTRLSNSNVFPSPTNDCNVESRKCERSEAQPRRVCDLEIDARRVCDLEIDAEQDGRFEVPHSISYVPLKEQHPVHPFADNAEFFSPYTQRVMHNLAKVYDEREDVKTPRGSDSLHPWQHDRLIQRVESLTDTSSGEEPCGRCSCSNSVFSGNDDLVEFFLPLMGSACSCGNKRPGLIVPEQPTSLVNILRPWQVTFLGRFGINFGEELVKSFHRSGSALAKALQQHRKKEGMTPFPLKSCAMALQIWSKTSKTFVRSIRDQLSQAAIESSTGTLGKDATGQLKVPNTLYLLSSFMDKMPSDNFMLESSGNLSNDVLRSLDPCAVSPVPVAKSNELKKTP